MISGAPSRSVLLQDRVNRALGRAGRAIGASCNVFRPKTSGQPLDSSNFVLKLAAGFAPPDAGWSKPVGHGQALWHGIFDGVYTRPGDYLVRHESRTGAADGGIWFVAAQQFLLPILCVRTSRVLTITRPAGPQAIGLNDYGGVLTTAVSILLEGWPASVIDGGGGGQYQADLPTTTTLGAWTVLLPSFPGPALRTGDHLSDDLGRSGVVSAAELSELGWRLNVRQVAT